jgi:integrase/recombinase XerD
MAGTRDWGVAENVKRELQDKLAGRPVAAKPDDNVRAVSDAVDTFIKDKKVQGVTPGVIKKYTLELSRLKQFCARKDVHTVPGITRELLTDFCETWPDFYPSSYTRAKVRERCRSFLRFCFECKWLERIPSLPKIKIEEPPTMPLSADEYARLLDAIHVANPRRWDGKMSSQGLTVNTSARIHALFQLMRWSGLAIRDAVTLERAEIQNEGKIYRIVTARQKTGTHVSVPIPPDVAKELLAVANGNERYAFWTGEGTGETIAKTWANRYVRPVFEAAKIPSDGHMLSHRLRDTFAVDLLEKGVPLEEVSKLLGHESIKTTERHYAKWVKGRQDRLDSLVIGTWKANGATQKQRA